MLVNKRGNEDIGEEVMFIILNIFFFLSLTVFIINSSSSAYSYEQTYAKRIAFYIDEAKPGMTLSVGMNDLADYAKKNKIDLSNAVKIDNANQRIYVSLGSGKGYGATYFSSYPVSVRVESGSNNLIITVTR